MNDSATRLNITSVRFNVVQLQTSVLPTWTGLTPPGSIKWASLKLRTQNVGSDWTDDII